MGAHFLPADTMGKSISNTDDSRPTWETVVDQFEAALLRGERPILGDYLAKETLSPEERTKFLLELVCAELEVRQKSGASVRVEEYLTRWPELNHDPFVMDLIGHEFRLRVNATPPPNQVEFAARFPQLADRFKSLFDAKPATLGAPLLNSSLDPQSIESFPATQAHFKLSDSPSARAANMPSTIGRYHILAALGSGGQGEVYRAAHPTLPKEVVIKRVRCRSIGNDAHQERLVSEARLLCELVHPNLARIYDLDFEAGQPFLVMEFIRGQNLRQFAAGQRISPKAATALLAKVARALFIPHQRGIVHLDIKPDNIVLDESNEPKVIDFGLARLRSAWDEDMPEKGDVYGTIPFMAPEQARGESDRLAATADVFAIGAVLYWFLVGRAPFAASSIETSLERARKCDFDRNALNLLPIDQRIKDVCLKAMQAEPSYRYQTTADLAKALDRCAHSWDRRKVIQWGSVAGVVCMAILGAWLATRKTETATNGRPLHVTSPTGENQPAGALVQTFNAIHFRDTATASQLVGPINSLNKSTCLNDQIRIEATFKEPVYCYLVAFNPDGQEQLCYPSDAQSPPAKLAKFDYPADPTEAFRLTDGTGEQVFALIASKSALPAYAEWRTQSGKAPWNSIEPSGVFRFDGQQLAVADRGTVEKLKGLDTVDQLCRFLRERSRADTVQLIAFPVLPR